MALSVNLVSAQRSPDYWRLERRITALEKNVGALNVSTGRLTNELKEANARIGNLENELRNIKAGDLKTISDRVASLEKAVATFPRGSGLVRVGSGEHPIGNLSPNPSGWIANTFVWGGNWHIKVWRLDEPGKLATNPAPEIDTRVRTSDADVIIPFFRPESNKVYWDCYKQRVFSNVMLEGRRQMGRKP